MTAWSDMDIQVERTTTEFADIKISIDLDDYASWLGGLEPTRRLLVEYIQAHHEYPANLPVDGAVWRENDVEWDIK